jgi:hypothetical protein
MPARKKPETPVLELHRGTGDERRRALYETAGDPVSAAELRRLWSQAQRALEDLALALPPLDGYRSPLVRMADVCRGKAER